MTPTAYAPPVTLAALTAAPFLAASGPEVSDSGSLVAADRAAVWAAFEPLRRAAEAAGEPVPSFDTLPTDPDAYKHAPTPHNAPHGPNTAPATPTTTSRKKPKKRRKKPSTAPDKCSAWQSVTRLLRALSRAEWGPLAGNEFKGVRATLRAICDALADNHEDVQGWGRVTAQQVAYRAGYSLRWTRVCLHFLEDLGIIEWWRGGIFEGETRPGTMRVHKTSLAALVDLARPLHTAADRARRKATAERISKLWRRTVPGKRFPRSNHAEVAASPSPLQGSREGATLPIPYAPPNSSAHTHPTTTRPTTTTPTISAPAVVEDNDEGADPLPPALIAYMRATYPGTPLHKWPRIIVRDRHARTLTNAGNE